MFPLCGISKDVIDNFYSQANLRTFEGPGFEDLQVARCRKYSTFSTFGVDESFVQRNMRSIWNLLNDPHSSELAKVKFEFQQD